MAGTFDIGSEIAEGAREVFSTMLMMDLQCGDTEGVHKKEIASNITSMIGLGGGLRGVLAVHCPKKVATAITGGFLGMEIEELDEDVKDAIGEIANMVAGSLKVSYSKIDINLELAIPTSIVGESFHISGIAEAKGVIIPLTTEHGKFWIELMYVLNK